VDEAGNLIDSPPSPGTKYTSIPAAAKQLVTKPGEAIREGWKSMGPAKGAISGVTRVEGKVLPRFVRSHEAAGALYPSLNRVMATGMGASQLNEARKAPKGEKGKAIGGALASVPAWMLTNRMPLVANMAAFVGLEAGGRALGGLFGRKERAKRLAKANAMRQQAQQQVPQQ